jgi:proline iminopeptidase
MTLANTNFRGRPLWQSLNSIALLLLILPKYVFPGRPWRCATSILRSTLAILAVASSCLATPAQQTASFQNAGLTLHYTIAGKGTPVVILSGGPGMDAAYMQPVADIVARHNTAILLDQRGTTGSMPATLDATTITPELYLSDLEALRISLGYKQWIVLGHSAGALTAMRYAIEHPDHTQALILLGTVPPRSATLGRMMDNVSVRLSPEVQKQVAAIDSTHQSPDAKMAAEIRLLFAADFYDRDAAAKFALTMTPETCHALTTQLLQNANPSFDLTNGLAKLHIPTLIVQGRQDPLDPEMASETRDAIPSAKLIILERAGHFSWLDSPTAFTSALQPFLAAQ